MLQPATILLAAAALFIPGALAGEGVHLANCGVSFDNPDTSLMVYYPDDSKSNTVAASQNIAYASPSEGVVAWEGNTWTGSFATGETFTSHIKSGSWEFQQYAGTGNNQQTQFACFRDNNRELWRASAVYACFSIYYCLDA
ncbi:hypothetical protein V8C35DRAFT_332620 [Trichoderma chlorosporum]